MSSPEIGVVAGLRQLWRGGSDMREAKRGGIAAGGLEPFPDDV